MAPQLASAIANCSKHAAQLSLRAAPHALCLHPLWSKQPTFYVEPIKRKPEPDQMGYVYKKKSPAHQLCRPPKHLKYTMKNFMTSKVVGATGFEPVTPCL